MASNIPTEALDIHNELVLYLGRHIVDTELNDLKNLFKNNPLTPVDIASIKNIYDLFDRLMKYAIIAEGDYTQFVRKLKLTNPNLESYVTEKENAIKRIVDGVIITRADLKLSEKAMESVIRQGNVVQIEAWVRDGLDLATWSDTNGYNIYHYCVDDDASYDALCVAEAIPRLCQTHAFLLSQVNKYKPSRTPLMQACHFSVNDDAYLLALLELFIRHREDIDYERLLLESRRNPRMNNYLAWRQKNPTGSNCLLISIVIINCSIKNVILLKLQMHHL
ncbi:uncharacterized protein LOC110455176 [Mizuhopecten yessoensis]|uniref:uncharacterized protein LOC110455176 n=1 Tax=Mizuhopecten yessoensis TaxID=6573 RepID=UPI000B45CBF6|nr:uncharacterized protein LOC110455176 [Mizuhopecten yessoensis]